MNGDGIPDLSVLQDQLTNVVTLCACALLAVVLSGCGTPSAVVGELSGSSAASPVPSTRSPAPSRGSSQSNDGGSAMAKPGPTVDDLIRTTLGAGRPVRALISLHMGKVPAAPGASPSEAGLGPGPYLDAKRALLAASGPGLTLVRDYNQLPIILVTIADMATLGRVVDSGLAQSVQGDRVNTVT